MSTITTISGIHFDPLRPDASLIRLDDIAHATARICRGNGHVKEFYSVAQHSIACACEAHARGYTPRVRLACLLHDAAEAYICDLIRPIKQELQPYILAENALLDMIWKKFLIRPPTADERSLVFSVDNDMLSCEFHQLMAEDINDDYKHLVAPPVCRFEPFETVEARYVQMTNELCAACAKARDE